MKKRLKPGQLFTMYNHVWQVRKCTRWPCGGCELYRYWKAFLPHMRWDIMLFLDNNPCDKLCRGNKEIIPSDCVAISIKRK